MSRLPCQSVMMIDSQNIPLSFTELRLLSARINYLSDSLRRSIDVIDEALKEINLGVEAFVSTSEEYVKLGYSKINGIWGLSITLDDGQNEPVVWRFNDAPRKFRLDSVDYIPALIVELNTAAISLAEQIEDKLQCQS